MHGSTFILLLFILFSLVLSIIIDIYSKQFSLMTIVGYIIAIILYYVILLDQECIHNGPCSIWGWVRVIFIILFFILLIIVKAYFIYLYQLAKKEDKKSKE